MPLEVLLCMPGGAGLSAARGANKLAPAEAARV